MMDAKMRELTQTTGFDASCDSIEAYKASYPDFSTEWEMPMHYASGFTAARLAHAISSEWIRPLKRQARIVGLSALAALVLLALAIFYVWSLVSFSSFVTFLLAFSPAVAALTFSLAKSYKLWAEAKKHLAEAKQIEIGATKAQHEAEC